MSVFVGPLHRLPRWLIAAFLLTVGVSVGLLIESQVSSQGSDAGNVDQPAVTQRTLTTAVQGLCQTQSLMDAGDLVGARVPFLNQSHLFLHSLAASVQDQDRDAATNLLIAMYKVEDLLALPTGLVNATPPPVGQATPAELIANLLTTVQQGAVPLGLTAPSC